MPGMNWKQVISDLQAKGFTQVQIALRCGCSQSTVSDISTGRTTEPGASIGLALIAMSKSKRQAKPTKEAA
jgi:transcriptional regulator with XRE-family HTH domain